MKLVVWKNHLGGQILCRSLETSKKRRQRHCSQMANFKKILSIQNKSRSVHSSGALRRLLQFCHFQLGKIGNFRIFAVCEESQNIQIVAVFVANFGVIFIINIIPQAVEPYKVSWNCGQNVKELHLIYFFYKFK